VLVVSDDSVAKVDRETYLCVGEGRGGICNV